MSNIVYRSIGIIETPYKEARNIPIQGAFDEKTEGCCCLEEKYADGLLDLDGFSHAILLYHFDKSGVVKLRTSPFLEKVEHGIFAIRGPARPNSIGLTVVKITRIEGRRLFFVGVDMLDGTPLLDIKPYVKYFDQKEKVVSGWVDKHFENGNIPRETILK
jgi:tRNA-Thr(GGU) m(6)t(6)A37 methyltransferase TsaA